MEDSTELKAQRPFHQEFTEELWKVNDPKLRHLGIRWIKQKKRKEKKRKEKKRKEKGKHESE